MTIIASIDESKIFFLDEVGFNVSMRSRRDRSLIGSRAVYTVPNIRSRNILVCSLISKNGIFLYKAQTRAYNTDFFSAFIDDILTKLESDNISNAVIIMDNVSFYRSQIISHKISDVGHRIMFLYPILAIFKPNRERFCSMEAKCKINKKFERNRAANNIENASRLILPDHFNNYYRHMLGFIPRCILEEPMVDE